MDAPERFSPHEALEAFDAERKLAQAEGGSVTPLAVRLGIEHVRFVERQIERLRSVRLLCSKYPSPPGAIALVIVNRLEHLFYRTFL
jgi:hypothetical protein